MNKKAQMNWIVKAILAIIVLVILVAVFYGVGGKSVGKLGALGEKTGSGADLETVKATCNQLCNDARIITDPTRWKSSKYCSNSYSIDMNSDGVISTDETGIKCFDPMISVYCTASLESWGIPGSCDKEDCIATNGCPKFICSGGKGVACTSITSTAAGCTAISKVGGGKCGAPTTSLGPCTGTGTTVDVCKDLYSTYTKCVAQNDPTLTGITCSWTQDTA